MGGTKCDGLTERHTRNHNGASTAKVGGDRMQVGVHGGVGSGNGAEPSTNSHPSTVADCTNDSSASKDQGDASDPQVNSVSGTLGVNMPIDADDNSRLSATAEYGCSYQEKDGQLVGGVMWRDRIASAPDSCNQQGQMHGSMARSFFIVPKGTTPSAAAAAYDALPQPALGQSRHRGQNSQPAGQRKHDRETSKSSPSANMVPQDETTRPLKKRRKNK